METEHRDDENMKPKQEDQSDETTMTASIVYLYMRKVTPKMAEEFLTTIKSVEVDMNCNISVEEVVREYSRSKKAVQECERFKDCSKGIKCKVKDDGENKSNGADGVTENKLQAAPEAEEIQTIPTRNSSAGRKEQEMVSKVELKHLVEAGENVAELKDCQKERKSAFSGEFLNKCNNMEGDVHEDFDIKIGFVIPHGKTEVTVTLVMSLAFDKSKEAGLSTMWIKEQDLLNVKPNKADVIVLDPFSGPAFNHVSQYSCSVLGPR